MVRRVALVPRQPEAGLVHLARPRARRRPAEQLDRGLHRRRERLDLRRRDRAVLPPPVPAAAARPQLAQPRSRRGDARHAAVLARSRRRRLPDGRDPRHRQARPTSRTSKTASQQMVDESRFDPPGDPRAAARRSARCSTAIPAIVSASARSTSCPRRRSPTYYGADDELHLAFNFPPLYAPWDARKWRTRIERVQQELDPRGAWPTWVLSNHDNPRHRTRYGSEARARAAAVLLLTLAGHAVPLPRRRARARGCGRATRSRRGPGWTRRVPRADPVDGRTRRTAGRARAVACRSRRRPANGRSRR